MPPSAVATSSSIAVDVSMIRDVFPSHAEGENEGADQPIAFVGASIYFTISGVAFKSVMLKPGPSRLVMNVPDNTLDNLIPRDPVLSLAEITL